MARAETKKGWKGKEWYEVVAPQMFDSQVLSETPASDVNQLMDRTLTVNASEISGNPAKYYYKLHFRVTDVEGNRAVTEFDGHTCARDSISRMVRRRADRIDTRDEITLDDGTEMVVKVVATTLRNTSTDVRTAIREEISETLQTITGGMSLDSFVEEMLSGSLQQLVQDRVSSVYPITGLEINKTQVVR